MSVVIKNNIIHSILVKVHHPLANSSAQRILCISSILFWGEQVTGFLSDLRYHFNYSEIIVKAVSMSPKKLQIIPACIFFVV